MWPRSSGLCKANWSTTYAGPRARTCIWVFRHACRARIPRAKPISVWTLTQPFLADRWWSVELELVTSCFRRAVKMVRGTKLWVGHELGRLFLFLTQKPHTAHTSCLLHFGGCYSILLWSDCDAAYVLNSIYVYFPVTVDYRRRYCELLAFMSIFELINKKMMKTITRVVDMVKGGTVQKLFVNAAIIC